MTEKADFGGHLTSFLTTYLSGTKNYSRNTVHAYRDTFKLFLIYSREKLGIPAERLQIRDITPDVVCGFIDWLKSERGSGLRTANHRLAVIHSFFRYLQYRAPEHLAQCRRILSVEMATVETPLVGYLTEEELRLIFAQTSESTREGRRDSVLLRLLYDTAARVQELCDMKVRDVYLDGNPHVMLHGKGNKSRYVPIVTEVARDVERYISENGLNRPEFADMPLFTNRKREKLSRAGVAYIVKKYADAAREKSPKIPKKVTPHMFRHTKATHLCQAGIDIIYIRDILGHCHVTTTEIYMKLNVERTRDALEDAYPELPSSGLPDWRADDSLMKTLNSL